MKKITGISLWCAIAALSTTAFLLFAQCQDAHAQSKPLVQLHFDGKTTASIKYRGLSISIDSASSAESPESKYPVFHLSFEDGRRLDVKLGEQQPVDEPVADASLFQLDSSSPFPQIVLTYYWEGAHCCTVTKIVTVDSSNKMLVVDGETLDGDGYSFEDVDLDGNLELLSSDNSFLYAFASYAESVAPAKVSKLRGNRLVDVTTEDSYRSILSMRLTDIESMDRESRKSNGYWGGWVATKAQMGQFAQAWETMLSSYDRNSDWSMQECFDYTPLEQCPKDKIRDLTFPEALAKHLQRQGYIKIGDMREAILLSQSPKYNKPQQRPDPSLESCMSGESVVRRIIIGELTGKRPEPGSESPSVTTRDFTLDGVNDRIDKTTCSATVDIDLRTLVSELAAKNEMRAASQLSRFAARRGARVNRRVTYTVQPTSESGRIWVTIIR
jgi:hypothetical protein